MGITRKEFLSSMVAATVLSFVGAANAQQAGPILIGATVPITGPLSLTGKQYQNSLAMAEEDINKAGGINGRQIKVVFEDTQASNGTAVNAFVKLAQETKPAFFFLSSYSTQNLAVAPELKKIGVPAMYAGGADAVADGGNEWMFRIRPADSVSAAGMVRAAVDVIKAKKPGILYIQNDFGQGGAQTAAKRFEAAGIPVVGMEAYGQNDKDFSAQLLSLRSKGADTILIFNYPQDGALVLRQAKLLGFKMPLVTSSAALVPAAMQLLSPADLEGVWGVVDTFMDATAGDRMKDYVERFKAKFGIDPDPYGLAYYDGAFLMADGMRKVGTDPKALREWLAAVKDWQGVGHVYSYDAKGNGVRDLAVVKAKAGSKTLELVQRVNLD
ncbi:ABC transporter substrate-binding protein [Rhodopseudomonas pseudopalustris]|uniref:Amino acid/amide ABC transporter substrate-binding protein, HAAT family n=1 Tax=Rhodopseudomonas pseudopalustris TaxID=1513892 RepID=A0A1H8VK33_9BRAD|nr:ABC transporter substrate-binding protein [Rhodopseudomonas pseudopalustris]MBB1093298.1 ABC transporter substrate-binding protein [Rhodopseudomonas palustris]SEP15766.1 amino acid/amide ABC transporter substrate-binding protein, HAAT family [Rhodopseudomonas pseudopalustris]